MKYLYLLAATLSLSACQQSPPPNATVSNPPPHSPIEFINGMQKAKIELAITDAEHAKGLMNRAQMATDAGMLFVFPNNNRACFWMKNTLIPLTIGFVDEHGVLQQTLDMQPQSLEARCPTQPFRYAIEMNQGWFARNNITPNTAILNIKNTP